MKKEILKYNLQRGIKDAGLWSQTNRFLILTPSCNTLWDLGHVSPSLYALFFHLQSEYNGSAQITQFYED